MALLGNYSVLLKSCGRSRSGSTVSDNRAAFNTPGSMRGQYVSEAGWSKLSAIPRGYTPGSMAWVPQFSGGDMSGVNEGQLSLTESTLNLAAGRNIIGDTTFTLTAADAELQLIVSADGTATATLTGTGNLAGSLAASGTASFTFTPSPALLGALAGLTASGSISLAGDAVITAIGELAGNILPYTELSPENLARAVWESLAASYNTAGTMGAKLNSAASAGDPWSTELPGTYTGDEAGAIVAQIQTLIEELHKIHGLSSGNPLTVTPTSREAGGVTQTITGDGTTSTVVTRT